ncbi:MAG: hypothetical protein MUC97_10665 [Bernardetiaceae bacterium]|jgi:hypothetical protein|nr:hypothetical protein [Bernardetiaceae bacterium]
MKKLSSLLAVGLCLLATAQARPTSDKEEGETADVRVSKKINLDFKASPQVALHISNKYGAVQLVAWAKDSVKLEAEVVAKAADRTQAERILERVTLNPVYDANSLTLNTEIQQAVAQTSGGGGLLEMLTSPFTSGNTRTSATAGGSTSNPGNIDQNNLQITLRLRVPAGALVNLDNKYGDLTLSGPLKGRAEINLLYGNLLAEQAISSLRLQLQNGKAQLKAVNSGHFDIKSGQLELSQGQDLTLVGNNAEVTIDSVAQLELDTRYGQLQAKRVGKLTGRTYLGKTHVDVLAREGNLTCRYGELSIGGFKTSFTALAVQGQNTQVTVQTGNLTDLKVELTGKTGQVEAPARLQPENSAASLPNQQTLRGTEGSGRRIIKIDNRDGRVQVQ